MPATIKEMLNAFDERELNRIIPILICPNEFHLKTYGDIGLCKTNNNEICPKCWEYALREAR